jgi:hypothetical protein
VYLWHILYATTGQAQLGGPCRQLLGLLQRHTMSCAVCLPVNRTRVGVLQCVSMSLSRIGQCDGWLWYVGHQSASRATSGTPGVGSDLCLGIGSSSLIMDRSSVRVCNQSVCI